MTVKTSQFMKKTFLIKLHYPFENKELFESTFPADFIAEGMDQVSELA